MANYSSSHTGAQIDDAVNQASNLNSIIESAIAAAKLAMYPVGSIYMSVSSTSPATFIGGTWQRIENTFLLAAGSSYAAGATGGEASHTLTTNETPAHTHTRGTMNITGNSAPAHSSGVCWYNVTGCSGAFYSNTSATNCGKPSLAGNFTGDHMLGFDASRSWTGETSSVGGNASHNNMPPYLAVYIWKRTA